MKIYAALVIGSLLVGGVVGYKLHLTPPPTKQSEDKKSSDLTVTTGPVHEDITEYSVCPPCAACGVPVVPSPTYQPPPARAATGSSGRSVKLPNAVRVALAHLGFDKPSSPAIIAQPMSAESSQELPYVVRHIILDQAATVQEKKTMDDKSVKEIPAPLPRFLVGAGAVDPLTSRYLYFSGGIRLFSTPIFIRGEFTPATKDWQLGAEINF